MPGAWRTRALHDTRELLLVGAAYAAVAIIWTYPLVLRLGSTVVWDGNSDLTEKLWNLWWFRTALVDLHASPFWTDHIYYPRGISLFLQPFNLPAAVVGVGLQPLFGLVASYNLLVLGSITLAAVTCYLLARGLVGRPGAFVAGLTYTFTWLHGAFITAGTLELISLQWLPLVALALLHLLARRSLGSIVLLALAMTATALASWYYALQAVVLVGVLGSSMLLTDRTTRRHPLALAAALGSATIATLALLAPILVPTVNDAGDMPNAVPDLRVILSYSAAPGDLLRLAVPPALVLAAAGIIAFPRRALPWAATTAVFFGLALGPVLDINGRSLEEVPMPYRLLQALPLADVGRFPVRFEIGAALGLAILAGLGLETVSLGLQRGRWRGPVVGVSVLVLLAALSLSLPALPVRALGVNPVYERLAADQTPGAVIDFPLRDRLRSYQMYYATVHRRPVVGGIASRSSPHGFVDDGELMKDLVFLTREPEEDIVARENGQRLLAAAGIRYLVLHRDLATPAEQQHFEQMLAWYLPGVPPYYQDEEVAAYEVPGGDGIPGIELATAPDSNWYGIEEQPSQPPWRWSAGAAAFRIISSAAETVELKLEIFSWQQPRSVEVQLNGETVQTLTVDDLSRRPPEAEIRLSLQTGENRVTFVPDGPAVRPPDDERDLSLGFRNVRLDPVP